VMPDELLMANTRRARARVVKGFVKSFDPILPRCQPAVESGVTTGGPVAALDMQG
jgi:hypothetical protein